MTDPLDSDIDIDVEDTPVTAHYGFTRIGAGEGFDKNGWAFGDADRTKLDDLLWALANHEHTGAPALGDPSDPPTLSSISTGGHLAASTTYYYRISFLDKWGLESAASPEASITTPDPVDPPTPPAGSVEVAGGTITAGTYSYLITASDIYGGETDPSDSTDVTVTTGGNNRIRLDLPDLPDGAASFTIYRARPGQTNYYKLVSTIDTIYFDAGLAEDQTITAPLLNTTNAGNAVNVSIASGVIPIGCVGWRIYRTDASGDYPGDSLVHEVTEGVSDSDATPVTSWLDTGDALLQGYPLAMSSTLPSPSVIDLADIQGHLPVTALPRGVQCISAAAAGALANGQTLTVTETISAVRPTRLTAFFKTPPGGGSSVTIRVADTAGATLDLICSSATARNGDPAGYYRLALPTTDAGTFQAEGGDRSDSTTVDIVTDLAAVSGQAVFLDTQAEWVQVPLGVLDAGSYTSSVSARVVAASGPTAGDLTVSAVRTDTGAVLASTAYPSADITATYPSSDYAGPNFTAPGGAPVTLRVAKTGGGATSYNVDSISVAPVVTTLAAGLITISAQVTGSAADVNVALWF